MENDAIVVLDVGKTISKLSLWSQKGALIARESRPNQRMTSAQIEVLDIDGIESWVLNTLSTFSRQAKISCIIPVAHGAALAAIRNDRLLFPPIDYEGSIPRKLRDAYLAERDPFGITGSPPLAEGLNAGVHLFRMERSFAGILEHATLLPWAQYWAWFLSGAACSDVTSLGCHTDLWCPAQGDFSPMAKRLGWAEKFAPLAFAGDVVGTIRPRVAERTGLPASVRVYCGLHDSNAALIAARAFSQINGREATVLSTGTWFVAMRTPDEIFDAGMLPDGRDCLVNVDAWGKSIPSARFMGGREIETLIGLDTRRVDIRPDQPYLLAAVPGLVQRKTMLQPTFAHGFGPFPNGRGRWVDMPDDWYSRRAAACLYAALVADTCLDLIGARETILVEGRFAEAEVIVQALAALRPADAIYTSHAHNDVSFGALRLINPDLKPDAELNRVEALPVDLLHYKEQWLALAQQAEAAA